MKRHIGLFLFLPLFAFFSTDVHSQAINSGRKAERIKGRYVSDEKNEMLVFDDAAFHLMRVENKLMDAVVPNCNELANGTWRQFKPGIFRLTGDTNLKKARFTIKEEAFGSKDSVYIKILLPKDEAFFKGRFKYDLFFSPGKINYLDADTNIITLNKQKVFFGDERIYHVGLTIQDMDPENCTLKGDCDQKIFFNICDDLELNTISNCFIITLSNFNECFVEHVDIDNELIVVDKNIIYWRGVVFKKVRDELSKPVMRAGR